VHGRSSSPEVEVGEFGSPASMDGREHLVDEIVHVDVAEKKRITRESVSELTETREGRERERDATHEDLYPASSSSSVLTSPFESIVKILELGMLTDLYDMASVILFPNPA